VQPGIWPPTCSGFSQSGNSLASQVNVAASKLASKLQMHRRYVEQLGIGAGARTLEVGCGQAMSEWLARRVAPDGTAVAVDLDLSLAEADVPNLELRRGDMVAGPVAPGDFDPVTARAVLHHVADARIAVENLVASARPGGATS
jgi:2-polyprenyl-3-methyl-5-hydroxy-6-metoxy-1,4-benzoquinol methylase